MKKETIKVLLIEDNPGDARLIREMLSKSNVSKYLVTHCESIKDALYNMNRGNFDVILLDLNLPNSLGYKTFERIHKEKPYIPIVLLTGIDNDELGEKTVKNGAQDYLVKGQIGSQLLSRVLLYSISRKKIEEELKDSQKELRDLSSHLQSIREDERARIALEIHDDLGQLLTALKMDLFWINKKIPVDNRPLLDKISKTIELANETIKSVKRMARELRPPLLELGVALAIENHVKEYQDHTGIKCNVIIDPEDIVLDKDLSLAVFRIFQELLTNVARHANALLVKIGLVTSEGFIELKVIDDGIGISKEKMKGNHSLGLLGIRERVRQWNGKVDIRGVHNKGTTVTVDIPTEEK